MSRLFEILFVGIIGVICGCLLAMVFGALQPAQITFRFGSVGLPCTFGYSALPVTYTGAPLAVNAIASAGTATATTSLLSPRTPVQARWISKPDWLYPQQWVLISPDDAILGSVKKADHDIFWSAFSGQGWCGDGEFMSLAAAKRCVEQEKLGF